MDDSVRYDRDGEQQYPSRDELEQTIQSNLSYWLAFAHDNPTLNEIEQYADEILGDLNTSIILPGFESQAADVCLAFGIQFERVKRWREWYQTLINLYDRITSSPEARGKLELALLRHFLYRGDPVRMDHMTEALVKMTDIPSNATLREIDLAMARIAIMIADYENGVEMAREVHDLACKMGDYLLLGKTYIVLTQVYLNLWKYQEAFATAQMAYVMGSAVHDDTLITNGLHYMALAFQVSPQPHKAFHYLELAMQYAYWTGDTLQINYTWQSWATCELYLGHYHEAEYYYHISLHALKDNYGQQHAGALHGRGVALLYLKRFDEAQPVLEKALAIWIKLKRPLEQFYTQHALAELYSLTGRHAGAVQLMTRTLEEAETMADRCGSVLLQTMRDDLKLYIERSNHKDSE